MCTQSLPIKGYSGHFEVVFSAKIKNNILPAVDSTQPLNLQSLLTAHTNPIQFVYMGFSLGHSGAGVYMDIIGIKMCHIYAPVGIF